MRQITMKGKSASSENGDSYKSYSDNENSDHENDSQKKVSGEEAESGDEEKDDQASDASEDESKSSKSGKKTGKRGKKKSKSDKKGKGSAPKQNEEYEVQKVIGKQKIFGKVHYLIRWKGYGPDDDTWEKEDTLSCPDLIKAYLENPAKAEAEEAASAKKRAAEQPASKTASKKKKVESAPATKKSSRSSNNKSPNKKPRYAEDSEDEDDDDKPRKSKTANKKGRGAADDNQGNDNKEYEVEKILDVHQLRNGGKEYLVKWKGYPPSQSTWESEENVRHCPEIVKRFLKQLDDAKSKTPRETRVNPKHTDRFTLTMKTGGRRVSKRNEGKQRTRYDDNE